MANAQVIQGIVRAVRPQFRDAHERVSFAAHAFLLADGYKLVAAGRAAEALEEIRANAPEVGLEGWRDADGNFATAYADATDERSAVLVKALPIDEKLLLHILKLEPSASPHTLELAVKNFTTDSSDAVGGFRNLDELVGLLEKALKSSSASSKATSSSAAPPSNRSSTAAQQNPSPSEPGLADPVTNLRDLPHGGDVGGDDMLPPGMPRDIAGIPSISGGLPRPGGGFPPAHPSGMHIGPHDPLFAGRNPRQPGFGLPEGPFPGARYDPIGPAGLEGFNASDLQRGPRQPHPDIMPPGRGGSNFDHMFG